MLELRASIVVAWAYVAMAGYGAELIRRSTGNNMPLGGLLWSALNSKADGMPSSVNRWLITIIVNGAHSDSMPISNQRDSRSKPPDIEVVISRSR